MSVSSTCGLSGAYQVVTLADGTPHLELIVSDPTGTCASVCDMESSHAVIVAVPVGTEGSVCTKRVDSCE